jgi:large subunit ribosomal protein L4
MATEKTTIKKVKPAAKTTKAAASVVKKTVASSKTPVATKKSTPGVKEVKAIRKEINTSVNLVTSTGNVEKTITLPKEIFGDKVNTQLLAQAVRVYLANQREGSAHTKTRGEVDGSSRKIYKQKGTGKARHGTIRAPIFVKGGVALGPKAHDFRLNLSKKMKIKALSSAFSSQVAHNSVTVLSGITSLEQKTKAFAALFQNLSMDRKTLLVISSKEHAVIKLVRNIPYITVLSAQTVHPYAVMTQKHVCLTEAALTELESRYRGENRV